MSDDTYHGWDPADRDRDERDYSGLHLHWDDDEPFGRPPAPEPDPLPAPPPSPVCTALRPFHGSRHAPLLCGGDIIDGKCQRCQRVKP